MKKLLLSFCAVLFVAACSTKPVMNVDNEAVPAYSTGKGLSINEVESSIVQAAVTRGWRPHVVKPGLIEADITLRQHQATIRIPYSASSYSIQYVDSANLSYGNGKIHRNYNNWIVRLNRDIQSQLWQKASR